MNYTIDASVFTASARESEAQHLVSVDFLKRLQAQRPAVFCPAILLAECSAALARRTGDPLLALQLVAEVESFVGMQLLLISTSRAERAAQIAAYHRLRGADAVYVVIAEEFAATLVTWDGEMLQRGAALVTTITPDDWLRAQSPTSSQP